MSNIVSSNLRDAIIKQVAHHGVVVDTGSAATVLSADYVARAGSIPEPDDILYTVRGIGGTEVVFSRQVDRMRVDAYTAETPGQIQDIPAFLGQQQRQQAAVDRIENAK